MKLPKSIKETQDGLAKKKFSAVQLVDEYLTRIEKYDGKINSFLTVSDELAYKQAKNVDKKIEDMGLKAFEEYPLLGVVVAHKDLFLVKGIRTTAGSKVLEDFIPTYSATIVKRLENAGAITIGKTN